MAAVTDAPPPISAPMSAETALRMAGSIGVFGSNERGCASNGSGAALHEPGDLGYSGGSPTAQRPSHPGKQSSRSAKIKGNYLICAIGRQCPQARTSARRRAGLFSCEVSRDGPQQLALRDLASRTHGRNAPKADMPEPTRMIHMRHWRDQGLAGVQRKSQAI